MNLPGLAMRHRTIVVSLATLLVAWGIVAFLTMPRREDPVFTIRNCVVTTSWAGASAEKVEQLITSPIEEAIDSIDEVDFVSSVTRPGFSVVTVEVEADISDGIDNVWDKVRAKIDTVAMPDGAGTPVVNDEFGDSNIMLMAVYQKSPGAGGAARTYSDRDLERFADTLKDSLRLVEGVARVELKGVRPEAIYLETDIGRWNQLDLTVDHLQDLVQARNIVAPGGSIDTADGRFPVKPSGELDAVDQLSRVIVGRNDAGAPVYLTDVGIEVRRGYEDPPRVITRVADPSMSARCVIVGFTMKDGENVTEVGRRVTARLLEMQEVDRLLPPDVGVLVLSDSPRTVDRKVSDFMTNIGQAVVIVVVVAYLMIGFRMAFVMALSIPMVIFTSLGLVRLFGVDLEQVSIAALIIALGMLVDNAIEVCDQTHRLEHEGKTPREAAIEGTREIMFPVLIATLTTVAAFLPMLLALTGSTKEYVYSLPVTVSVTLLVSWAMAMSFVVITAYWFIRPSKDPLRPASPLVRLYHIARPPSGERSTTSSRYSTIAGVCLRAKWPTVIVAMVAFLLAVRLPVGTQFFPQDARDQFVIDVWLPEASSIAQTDAAAREIEQIVRDLSGYTDEDGNPGERLFAMRTVVGEGGTRWYLSLNPEQRAANYAQLLVRTTDKQLTAGYVADVREAVADHRARVVAKQLSMGPPVDSPIGIRLYGAGFADMHVMRDYADRIAAELRETQGTFDVHDSWGSLGYELDVIVDQDAANLSGVSNAAVSRSLNTFFAGQYLTTYRENDHTIPVYLRLPSDQRSDLASLNAAHVEGQAGKVPLDVVARVEPDWQPGKIERRKLDRMIEVRANVDEGMLANDVLAAAMPGIRAIEADLPTGFKIEIAGEQEKSSESQAEMATSFGISLLLIVFLLVVQYNTLSKPLIILMTLPMAATGAFIGLYVTDNVLGFMPQLGLVSLCGIVLNGAIVYIEFAEKLMRQKLKAGEGRAKQGEKSCGGLTREAFHQCLVRAGEMRMQPIMLTTLTTMGGLVPLALFGGPLWEGMAYVLIFGLFISTALTLIVLPAVYAIFVEVFRMKPVRGEV